jgi:hypothetical protein
VSNATTLVASACGTPLAAYAAAAASTRARSPGASSAGNRVASAATCGVKCAMVAVMSSVSRRERRNHVVPRAMSRLVSISMADCAASSATLSSASIAFHRSTKSKISRVSR